MPTLYNICHKVAKVETEPVGGFNRHDGDSQMSNQKQLIKNLSTMARDKKRYRVFDDFIYLSATSLHNQGAWFDQKREDNYLSMIKSYDKEDRFLMAENLGLLIELLQDHPHDALGDIYMNLELGDKHQGQFFTPDSVSQLMANLQCPNIEEVLKDKPFFEMLEPACGAGGMVLAVVKNVIKQGYNPATKMWVQAIDIDRTAALMCYIQLSLWNVPAQVIVGNSLTLETNEIWFTPAYVMYGWSSRLQSVIAVKEQATEQSPVEQPATKITDFDPVKYATDDIIQLAFAF